MRAIKIKMFINFIASCAAPVAFALSADEIKGPADVAMLLYLLHPFVYVVAYAATAYRKPRYWRHSGEYLFVMRDIFFVSLANTFLLFRGTFFAALLFSILFSGLSAYPHCSVRHLPHLPLRSSPHSCVVRSSRQLLS